MNIEHGSFVSMLKRVQGRASALAAKGDRRAAEAHQFLGEALRAAQSPYEGPRCARSDCANSVVYEGRGRRPLYCSAACRQWTARRARQSAKGG